MQKSATFPAFRSIYKQYTGSRMKNFLLIALLLSWTSSAQTPPPPMTPPPSMTEHPRSFDWEAEGMKLLMERFDIDKDGKLNDEEKRAVSVMAKKLLNEKRKAIFEKYDQNGNGRLDPDELATMRGDWERQNPGIGRRVRHRMRESRRDNRLELRRRFDKDGDGRLNDEERASLQQWLQSRSGQQTDRISHRPNKPLTTENERGHESLPPLPPPNRFEENQTPPHRADKEEIPGQKIVIEALLSEKHHRDNRFENAPFLPPNRPQRDK